uniref:Uncharacterized protein n=1 Tax=Amphimedon queenslandica TaxID=400682 RepID=A0A1X7VW63_AMPQE
MWSSPFLYRLTRTKLNLSPLAHSTALFNELIIGIQALLLRLIPEKEYFKPLSPNAVCCLGMGIVLPPIFTILGL